MAISSLAGKPAPKELLIDVAALERRFEQGMARQVRETFPTLRDLDIVDLNLEDLFLEYMKEDGNGR